MDQCLKLHINTQIATFHANTTIIQTSGQQMLSNTKHRLSSIKFFVGFMYCDFLFLNIYAYLSALNLPRKWLFLKMFLVCILLRLIFNCICMIFSYYNLTFYWLYRYFNGINNKIMRVNVTFFLKFPLFYLKLVCSFINFEFSVFVLTASVLI